MDWLPGEYHRSHRLVEREGSIRERFVASDPERIKSVLTQGLCFDLPHPFHQDLMDAVERTKLHNSLAQHVSETFEKDYERIVGAVSSRFGQDRFMGPNSVCKYWFEWHLDLFDGIDHDELSGTTKYRPSSRTFDTEVTGALRHELRTTFVAWFCPCCEFRSAYEVLLEESSDFDTEQECPVCGFSKRRHDVASYSRRVARAVEHVPFAELVGDPERFHLRRLRTTAHFWCWPEDERIIDPQLPNCLRIWASIRSGAWDPPAGPSFQEALCGPVVFEGIFRCASAMMSTTDAGVLRARLFGGGYGHMGSCEAELDIVRIRRIATSI